MENKSNNVIPFRAKNNRSDRPATLADMRAAASGTIAFVVLLMVGFNFSLFQTQKEILKQEQIQRGLASVSNSSKQELQRNLAQLNQKMISETAKKPTAAESLSFGLLEGKYSLQMQSGRVLQIHFSDSNDQKPSQINDRREFIQKYSLALAPGLKSIEKLESRNDKGHLVENYRVTSAHGQSVFEFKMDNQQRLLSLDVH